MNAGMCAGSLSWTIVFLFLLGSASGTRIWETIYQELNATYSCFKITNATHEFGCRADFSGNVGELHVVNSTADQQALLASTRRRSLVVVLPRSQFTVATLQQLEVMSADPDKADVMGVLLTLADDSWDPASVQFSEDDVCPNRVSSFYRSAGSEKEYNYCFENPWNAFGTGMFKRSWSFPIILLKDEAQISDVYECHARYNLADAWPRCAAQMRTFMSAAGNTEVCTRRTRHQYINTKTSVYCSDMGSVNAFGALSAPTADAPLVLLAARTDGATMFDALAPSADSAAVGLVTLLAVARALAALGPLPDGSMNVMFMLFSGESFDYIGSDRFVWDVSRGQFPPQSVPADDEAAGAVRRPPPLRLRDLRLYLELSQLAAGDTLFIHSDPVSRAADARVDGEVAQLVGQLLNYSSADRYNLSMAPSAAQRPLPPSSLHTLLKANASLPGVVVADHDAAYTNRRYHSVYDVAAATDDLVDRLSRLTQVVTSAIYTSATGQVAPPVDADSDWIRGLLRCYLEQSDCAVFHGVMNKLLVDSYHRGRWQMDAPIPSYVSVAGQLTMHSYLMELTQNLLANATGTVLNITAAEHCSDSKDKVNVYRWLLGEVDNGTLEGFCSRSLVATSPASSPAFEIDGYDWASGQHPSWAESEWGDFQLRLFLVPSLAHDLLHLLLGVCVTAAAVGAVLLLERRSHLVFASPRYELQS